MKKIYDVIIIGAGPAGLSAAIYAGRARLDALILEKGYDGGQMIITADIENYPGGADDETGPSLTEKMASQANKFGVKKIYDNIKEVTLLGDIKVLKGSEGTYHTRSIIIATGAFPRLLGCPGEKDLTGGGVSYCATCDGAFFRDMQVYVIGGGDSAVEEAIFLTRYARNVTIIHRRDELRATKSIQEHALSNPKIDFIWDSVIKEIKGVDFVSSIVIENVKTNEQKELFGNEDEGGFGIFVFIGLIPNTKIFEDKLNMQDGYIVTDQDMKTGIPGVFAAGDVRVKSLRQIVTAAADGAVAAMQVDKYLTEQANEQK